MARGFVGSGVAAAVVLVAWMGGGVKKLASWCVAGCPLTPWRGGEDGPAVKVGVQEGQGLVLIRIFVI